jgi:prevent-host-death family protein
MTVISARELNQDVSAAKRAAADGPVFITDRGRPSFVLMTMEAYERLKKPQHDLVEYLSLDSDDDEFETQPLELDLKVPDL